MPFTGRALRFARAWLLGPAPVQEDEVAIDRDGRVVPATIVGPARAHGRLPSWVVLHGITPTGRAHEQLTRFTRSLASSGAFAIVPEIPEWRALRLAPHLATPTVRAAVRALRAATPPIEGRVGVIGFSFGAPHAIASSANADLAEEIAAVVGFGGYADVESTFRFMIGNGAPSGGPPPTADPFGRWIVGANYLAAIPGLDGGAEVAGALRNLASHAGALTIPSWDPAHDPLITRLRGGLAAPHRALFDRFVTTSGAAVGSGGARETDPEEAPAHIPSAAELTALLVDTALARDPMLDPTDLLARVERPVHILHGRNDRLISSAEAPRLRAALPDGTPVRMTITRLFAHSRQDPLPILNGLHEIPRFYRALSRVLDIR